MSYQNQSTFNSIGGSLTFSNTQNKEYVALSNFFGSNIVMNNNGISMFSPNNYQTKVDNDYYLTVNGDYNFYVEKTAYFRYNGDIHHIYGDTSSMVLDTYNKWSDEFAKISSATTQPDTTVPSFPMTPGVPISDIPQTPEQGTRAPNPAITEIQQAASNGLTLNDVSISTSHVTGVGSSAAASAFQKIIEEQTKSITCQMTRTVEQITNNVDILTTQLSCTVSTLNTYQSKNLGKTSSSTAGGSYPPNPNK